MTPARDAAKNRTNAMRLLEKNGIEHRVYGYDALDGRIDGLSVALKTGLPPERVCKTLVCLGSDGEYRVFVIPVGKTLDLKRAAKAAGVKSVEMIPVADINKVTGYVRGGCSPVGMKKHYATIIDSSCLALEKIAVSAGKIGLQIELAPRDLFRIMKARAEDVATD
jgi:Cys-tRNA(Pro)/Cys-tRNA(Cys) deacylase